jgi:hypothetical protein
VGCAISAGPSRGTDILTVSIFPFSRRRSHSPQWISAKPPCANACRDKVLICWVRSTTPVIGESGRLSLRTIAARGPRLGINNAGGGLGGPVTENVGSRSAELTCEAGLDESLVGDTGNGSALSGRAIWSADVPCTGMRERSAIGDPKYDDESEVYDELEASGDSEF